MNYEIIKLILMLAVIWDSGFDYLSQERTLHERILVGHRVDVRCVAFSPDGKMLASAGYSHDDDRERAGEIKLWDLARGAERRTLKGRHGVVFVAFSTDGKTLVSGGNHIVDDNNQPRVINELTLWDVDSGEQRATFEGQPGDVFSTTFAFSPMAGLLALGSVDGVIVWESIKRTQSRLNSGEHVTVLAFSPGGKSLAAGSSQDDTHEFARRRELFQLKLLDPATGKALLSFNGSGDDARLISLAFSPNGHILVGGHANGELTLWDLRSKTESVLLKQSVRFGSRINSVVFSPDGEMLASGSGDGILTLWEVRSRRKLGSLDHKGEWINSLAFSPDGKTIASGSSARTIRLLDAANILERPLDKQR